MWTEMIVGVDPGRSKKGVMKCRVQSEAYVS